MLVHHRAATRAAASILLLAGFSSALAACRSGQVLEPVVSSPPASASVTESPVPIGSPAPTESPSSSQLTLKPSDTRSDASTDGSSSPSTDASASPDASSSAAPDDAAPDEWFTAGSTFALPEAADPIGADLLEDGIGQLSSDSEASDYAISGSCRHGLDSAQGVLETTCRITDLNHPDRTATWVITATPVTDGELSLSGTVR